MERPLGRPRPPRYGFWATWGLTLLALLGGMVGSYLVALGYAFGLLVTRPDVDPRALGDLLTGDGTLLSLTVILGGALTIAFVALFVHLRRRIGAAEYLAWRWPGTGTILVWIGVAFLYLVVVQLLALVTGVEVGGDFMVDAFCTAWPPITWIAFVVAAPLSEELLFRGFVLGGLADSRVGPTVAVVLSGLVWALLHVQYELVAMGMLFGAGLLFGYARVRTGSVVPPLLMHMAWNAVAVTVTSLEALGPDGRCAV